jgi:hypothetical protein
LGLLLLLHRLLQLGLVDPVVLLALLGQLVLEVLEVPEGLEDNNIFRYLVDMNYLVGMNSMNCSYLKQKQ